MGRIRPPSRASRSSQPCAICAEARGEGAAGAGCAREVALARGSLSHCRVPDKKAPQAARPGSNFLGNVELATEDTEVNLCH